MRTIFIVSLFSVALLAARAARPSLPPAPEAMMDNDVQPGTDKVNPRDGQKYVWIPPGHFRMGCLDESNIMNCGGDDLPSHEVDISKGFWLGQTEVTQAAFKRVMKTNPSQFQGDALPVEQVSWDDAKKYCETIGGRLPTEAEWEYAARAGNTTGLYGEVNSIAWHGHNIGHTSPVAMKTPNHWNLYDMLGNVWEWTADWYGPYRAAATVDPHGPPSGNSHPIRGASWMNPPWFVRFSQRAEVSLGGSNIGFRCVGKLP